MSDVEAVIRFKLSVDTTLPPTSMPKRGDCDLNSPSFESSMGPIDPKEPRSKFPTLPPAPRVREDIISFSFMYSFFTLAAPSIIDSVKAGMVVQPPSGTSCEVFVLGPVSCFSFSNSCRADARFGSITRA